MTDSKSTGRSSKVKEVMNANSKREEAASAKLRINQRTGKLSLTVQLDQESVINAAKKAIARQFKRQSSVFDHPQKVKDFLLLHLAPYEREVFACLFLDNKNRLIAFEPLFYGSIRSSHVSSREVIKRALNLNAAAVIVAHNHPSGDSEPSPEDELMTEELNTALRYSDIRLVDHFVVGGDKVVSMVNCGLFVSG